MNPALGHVGEFQPDNESITTYLKRALLFFEVNNIMDEKQVT